MKYTGGCHCENVRYEVELEIEKLVSCNCSICIKKGHLLAFVPTTQFKLLTGSSDIHDYQFASKNIHHYFCSNCGVSSFGEGSLPDGTKMNSINVRCLDGIDLSKYEITHYDGKSL